MSLRLKTVSRRASSVKDDLPFLDLHCGCARGDFLRCAADVARCGRCRQIHVDLYLASIGFLFWPLLAFLLWQQGAELTLDYLGLWSFLVGLVALGCAVPLFLWTMLTPLYILFLLGVIASAVVAIALRIFLPKQRKTAPELLRRLREEFGPDGRSHAVALQHWCLR